MDGIVTEYPEVKISEGEAEETDSLLTADEVASLLQVHISTVRRWNTLGILQSFRTGSRGVRQFRKKDVITSMLIFKPYSLPIGLL
jgi:excisionase family DNA binding protein